MRHKLITSLAICALAVSSCSVEEEYTSNPLANYNALWKILDEGFVALPPI